MAAQQDTELSRIGRTVLGGAAGGFTYDGALRDAIARERSARRAMPPVRRREGEPAPGALPKPARRGDATQDGPSASA